MNKYFVDFHGRKNTTILSIKGKHLYCACVEADNIKQARELAWTEFGERKISIFSCSPDLFRLDIEKVTPATEKLWGRIIMNNTLQEMTK